MNVVLRYEKARDNDRRFKRWRQWGEADHQIKRQLFLNHCTKIQTSKAKRTFKTLIPLANQKYTFNLLQTRLSHQFEMYVFFFF